MSATWDDAIQVTVYEPRTTVTATEPDDTGRYLVHIERDGVVHTGISDGRVVSFREELPDWALVALHEWGDMRRREYIERAEINMTLMGDDDA